MAAITSSSDASNINRALQVEFARIRHEPQQSKDLLSGVLESKDNLIYKTYHDFVDKIEAADVSAANVYAALLNSASFQVPANRRRVVNTYSKVIHVPFPRAHARKKGMSLRELASLYREAAKAAFERSMQELKLGVIEAPSYRETEISGLSGTTGTEPGDGLTVQADAVKSLPLTQFAVPFAEKMGSSSNYYIRPTLDMFYGVAAEFDNVIGKSALSGQGPMSMSIDGIERVCVMSNSGWAHFNKTNESILGNKDYFGRNVSIGGYGMYKMIHDFLIITLPDESFPAVPALTASTVSNLSKFQAAGGLWDEPATLESGSGFYHNGTAPTASRRANSQFLNVSGLYRALFFSVKNIKLYDPKQLKVDWYVYRIQGKSMEQAVYALMSLEGLRCIDSLVKTVLFGGSRQTLAAGNLPT